ncbi:adenosylcobinamide-GDP ribazoletransferase [Nonomuraea endophytica]|uniref:Adenosylcobinamide-GDP ribazoletransferase n=1 Tax=Nonomuraea endophytica TaxID=714136 RepID=A0A7W8EIY2_9ACTN|nr:adenosylcobinamide-GDP ribazoletransferase [Nonomuraea endophytica]MBB5082525.1 adenosylcobinamide-GDP ribazoletransferase [Nonomuraea endophytica]
MDGLRFAFGTLSVFPVRVSRVDREVAGRAMALAPLAGLVLGVVAAVPLLLPLVSPGPPLLAAALSLGLLALLTRGLHLDGLADLADGLGSGKPAPQALDIMKKSDIGPFGVLTLVFTLLIQAAALSGLPAWLGAASLVTACATGRLALTWACRADVPAARPDGLGAMVAATVRPAARWTTTLATLTLILALAVGLQAWLPGSPGARPGLGWLPVAVVLPLAVVAGLAAAMALLGHARRRLGGITGDVLGALVETATTAALVTCALLT